MGTEAWTRRPSPQLEAGERTHLARGPIDHAMALAQHAAYRRALAGLGIEVRELAPLPELPDAAFVEDPLLVLDRLLVLARPGASSRRAEVAAVERELSALFEASGQRVDMARIVAPGTLEGGDVLRIDDVLYVGQSTRTNHAGLKQLAHAVLQHGLRVKAAAVEGCLHLKTACSYLGRGVLLANERWVDLHRLPTLDVIAVDPLEPFAGNALAHAGRVLVSKTHPRTAERIRDRGFDVTTVDISEFEKAEAGLTCLSVLVSDKLSAS